MGAGRSVRKMLGLRQEMSFGFYLTDLLMRKILRQNAGVPWAIHHTSTIHCPERLKRGRAVYPGDSPGVYINATNGVEIGDAVNIGPNVGIISANHDFINNASYTEAKPIVIGAHSWLGFGAVVLPEVVLGAFTIVGANSVVTKSFPEGYCVVAGNPAKVIRQLDRNECERYAATFGSRS